MDRIQERIFIVKLINDKNDPSRDLDRFREFVNIGPFDEMFAIPPDEKQKILASDTELMLFAFRLLRQVLFGENTITLQADALEKHLEHWRKIQERRAAEAPGEPGDIE